MYANLCLSVLTELLCFHWKDFREMINLGVLIENLWRKWNFC